MSWASVAYHGIPMALRHGDKVALDRLKPTMTLLQSIILGIVEGITEFLPISSTGHLILTSRLLGLSQTDCHKSFEIAIELGAIAPVIVLYWKRFLELAVVSRVLVAFLPTGLIGL